jgi:uncharacterized Zn finger protein
MKIPPAPTSPPPPISAAASLLADGRVEIIERTSRILVAEIDGRRGQRRKIVHDGFRWHCTCPAWHHRRHCSHVEAVKLIAAPPGFRRLRPLNDNAVVRQQQQQLELVESSVFRNGVAAP